jgi:hypothetical protein
MGKPKKPLKGSAKRTWVRSAVASLKGGTTLLIIGTLVAFFVALMGYQQYLCSNNYKAYEITMDNHHREIEEYRQQIQQLKTLNGQALDYFLFLLRGSDEERKHAMEYDAFLKKQLSPTGGGK